MERGVRPRGSDEDEYKVSQTLIDERLLVDEVVEALTGDPEGESCEGQTDLSQQMQRAAEEFDRRTAEAFGKALVDSLCEDPGDVRRLEALLILGLAHPRILEKYQVSLAAEGRRLCVLLENKGDLPRARSLLEVLVKHEPGDRGLQQDLSSLMRRTGNVDELIDRCLARADEAVRSGRPMDAIPWLQEILLNDQSRRDVARMIRDLRYEEMAHRSRIKRRNRLALLLVVISTTLSALFLRENHIHGEYQALPPVALEDAGALSARLAGIDQLISQNKFWLGMFRVVGERSELQEQMDRLEARMAAKERRRIQRLGQQQAMAEASRLKALDLVERGQFRSALSHLQRSLELSTPDWERRERVSADVAALQKLLTEGN